MCGCGQPVRLKSHRFVYGHSQRTQPTGDKAYRWKGGQQQSKGYVLLFQPDHPRADKRGYIRRSHLVVEASIGRPVNHREVVHHRNQIRDDDRIENLELLPSQSFHIALHNRDIKRAKKLTEQDVKDIKRLLALPHPKPKWRERDPLSIKRIAERFGVAFSTVASIRNGEYWKWVTVD